MVRVRLEYESGAAGATRVPTFRARIRGGRWSLDAPLSPSMRAEIARRRGTVHSYPLFTGYLPRRIRGELRSYQVLPAR